MVDHRPSMAEPGRRAVCPACGGSGIAHMTCDAFIGAAAIPCDHCGGHRLRLSEDRVFLIQLAMAVSVATVSVAWIAIFV